MKQLAIQTLMVIQSILKAPKSQYNSFGKYNYRNCEDILEALKPICKEYNSAVVLTDDVVTIGDRYYVKATATLYCFNGTDVDSISASAFAREEQDKKGMDGSQVTGASSSYARKYALNGLFAIDDTKDSDSTNTHGKEESFEQYICADCGNEVKAFGNYSAKQVAGINQKKYGRILCADCSSKLKVN